MTWFDLAPDELEVYRPEPLEPPDFDAFWADTLSAARGHRATLDRNPVRARLPAIEVEDVAFPGFDGQPIRGWLLTPRGAGAGAPAIVRYIGYGGGRGLPYDHLLWPSVGFVTLVMDTRGQGSTWSPGDTPDRGADASGPQYPGFLTRGITDPSTYYYRRLLTDAVRAVDAIRTDPMVDPARVVVAGASQGGAMTLAVTALVPDIAAALIDVPFLCDIERAITVTDTDPYAELVRWLAIHRDRVADALATVAYVDGVHFARRARGPALFSVGLTDRITPPSTVYAAFNHYTGPKQLRVWPYSGHDAGELHHVPEQLAFLDGLGLLSSDG